MSVAAITRRRWFQFRLRTLLLVILFLSIALAAARHRWQVWQSERQAYQSIRNPGLHYLHLFYDENTVKTSEPLAPAWQRFCFGEFTGTTRVELTLRGSVQAVPVFERDENGVYVARHSTMRYVNPLENPQTLQSILALDRLDGITLWGRPASEDVLQSPTCIEKIEEVHRRFPNCKVVSVP